MNQIEVLLPAKIPVINYRVLAFGEKDCLQMEGEKER